MSSLLINLLLFSLFCIPCICNEYIIISNSTCIRERYNSIVIKDIYNDNISIENYNITIYISQHNEVLNNNIIDNSIIDNNNIIKSIINYNNIKVIELKYITPDINNYYLNIYINNISTLNSPYYIELYDDINVIELHHLYGNILCGITLFILIFYLINLLYFHNHPIIKAASPIFLYLLCCGGIFIIIGIFLENNAEYLNKNLCFSSTLLYEVGFTLSFLGISFKIHRISKIFNNATMSYKESKMSNYELLTPVLSISFFILVVTIIQEFIDPFSFTTAKYSSNLLFSSVGCRATYNIFASLYFVYNFILLCFGFYVSYNSRNAPMVFNESFLFQLAAFNYMFFTILSYSNLFVAASPQYAFAINIYGDIWCLFLFFMLIFGPKCYDICSEFGGNDVVIVNMKNRNKKSSQFNIQSSGYEMPKLGSEEMISPKAPYIGTVSTPLLDRSTDNEEVEYLAQDFEALKDAYGEQRDALIVVNREKNLMASEIKELRRRLEIFLTSPVVQENTLSSLSSPDEINNSKYINEATKQAILEILKLTPPPNGEVIPKFIRPLTAPLIPQLDRAKSQNADDRLQALRFLLPQHVPDISTLPKSRQHDPNKPIHTVSFSPSATKLYDSPTTLNSFKSDANSKSRSLILNRQSGDIFSSPSSQDQNPTISEAVKNDNLNINNQNLPTGSRPKSRYNVRNSISRFQSFFMQASPLADDISNKISSANQFETNIETNICQENVEGDILKRRLSGVLISSDVAHIIRQSPSSRRTSTIENSKNSNIDSRRTSTIESLKDSAIVDSRRTSTVDRISDSRRPSHVESVAEYDEIDSYAATGDLLTSRTRLSAVSHLESQNAEIPQVIDEIHGRLLNRLSFNKFRGIKIPPAPVIYSPSLSANQNYTNDIYGLDGDNKPNNSTLFFQAKSHKYHLSVNIPESKRNDLKEVNFNIPSNYENNFNSDENNDAEVNSKKFTFNDFTKIGKRQAISASAAFRSVSSP